MAERVAIVGSREHPNLDMVRGYVRRLAKGTVIVSGGARGVDATASDEANQCCHLSIMEWTTPHVLTAFSVSHRDALIFRNTEIALDCTRMVVFPDGSKGGCWDAARQAKRFRRPCEVRWADGRIEEFD